MPDQIKVKVHGVEWQVMEDAGMEVFRLMAGEGILEWNITCIFHIKRGWPRLYWSSNGFALLLPFLVIVWTGHRVPRISMEV